jgi:hypothetical protein
MEILRKYCLNDNPVKLQVLSDQAANFPTKCARRRAHPPLPNRIQRAADRSDWRCPSTSLKVALRRHHHREHGSLKPYACP